MKTFCAKVVVRLKPSVPDTRGETLKRAIESLLPIKNLYCRVGTSYSFIFDAEDQVEALNLVNEIAIELLTNEFAEEFEVRGLDETTSHC